MNINQRGIGNTNILKEIQLASKDISEKTGLAEAMKLFPETPKVDESSLGAAASLNKIQRANIPSDQQKMLQEMFGNSHSEQKVTESRPIQSPVVSGSGNVKFDFMKSASQRLIDDIEMLGDTKEYFSALQSMLSLYALGYLDDDVLDKISREDLKEIKGILREFKSIIDEY